MHTYEETLVVKYLKTLQRKGCSGRFPLIRRRICSFLFFRYEFTSHVTMLEMHVFC